MANRKPNQDSKEALIGRLMLAMRRSSAAGVLHGQAIARRVGINSSDLECLDLILLNGPSTAGDIARRTGLTSGAVTGLIDRLERLGLVERMADAQDRRKVLVRVREDKIAPIGALFAPMEKSMQGLLAGYSRDELKTLLDFAERAGEFMLTRVAELNDGQWNPAMTIISRRNTLIGALLAATPALAQTWPSRPIRYVVPFAAGAGVLDIMARIVAQRLTEKLDQQVVVDNKPGAGGNVGADIVAKAAPDGYTMLMANTALVVSPYLYAKMTFDPLADLVPVTMVNSAPLMLVVHPSVPAKSVAEFLAYARANPGKLNYGSGGVGTTPFLATELLKSMTGIDAVHVPYKGGAPALADLVAGQLAFMVENVPGTLPLVKDGKLRALAITSRKRSPLVPDLPTMEEAGVAGYEMVGWNGVFLPKGTPGEIGDKLHAALTAVLRSKPVQEQMAALGAEPIGNRQATFAAFVKSESARWGAIIREKGIKPE